MNWFIYALGAQFLWSIVNHADKFLLEKHFKGKRGVGALMVFSTLFAVVLLPIFYFIDNSVFSLPLAYILVLIAAGFLGSLSILFYLRAINQDEASVVVPFFQLSPVFAFVLGYIFLNEQLNALQIVAGLVIILGALILSLEIGEENKYRIKKHIIFLMSMSCFLGATQYLLFKMVTIETSFAATSFWMYFAYVLFGLTLFSIKRIRMEFIYLIKNGRRSIIVVNHASEFLTLGGNLLFAFATLLAPLALVYLIYPYQPLFVFVEGILITLFFPRIATEKISSKHLLHKLSAIIVIFIGGYLLQL
jgi:uncharacterized membrane protein